VAFWLLVWQVAAMVLDAIYPQGHLLLPSPISALARLGELVLTIAFWQSIGQSFLRIVGGFLIACLAASLLAVPASRWKWVRELLSPLVATVKAVPVASFIILALVWLSSRSLALFISALMVFPPVYLNVLEGIRQTDRKLLEMAKVFRVPLWRQVPWL
jgi:NitT/TauT family transport system permease protein